MNKINIKRNYAYRFKTITKKQLKLFNKLQKLSEELKYY